MRGVSCASSLGLSELARSGALVTPASLGHSIIRSPDPPIFSASPCLRGESLIFPVFRSSRSSPCLRVSVVKVGFPGFPITCDLGDELHPPPPASQVIPDWRGVQRLSLDWRKLQRFWVPITRCRRSRRSPDRRALRAHPLPAHPMASHFGVSFRGTVPIHPGLACTSAITLELA
jgi:hypothetical protein